MEDLKKALKKLGWSADQIQYFFDEESRPDDAPSIDEIVEQIQATQKDVFISTLGPELRTAAVEEEITTYKKGERRRIAKLVGLNLTRKETDALTNEELLEKAKAHLEQERATLSQATNEETLAKLDEWKTKHREVQQALEELEESMDEKIQAAEQSAQQKINKYEIDKLTNSVRDFTNPKQGEKREWARESDRVAGHHYILTKIFERYDVKPDGTILNKDGTKATNFEENSTYATIQEPYDYLFNELGYGKQSNGDEGERRVTTSGGVVISDKMSDNAKKMAERIAQSKQRHKHVPGTNG